MIGAVAVAIGATHPRRHMDVLVMHPLILSGSLQILRGVAEVTAVGWRFADDVEEDLVLGIKPALVIACDDFLPVKFRIVKIFQLRCSPFY